MIYKISLWIMAILYVIAGLNHFIRPRMYVSIMPRFLPKPSSQPLVGISGACEIVLGVLLIPENTRHMAAWLIIALLIAVFPANVQMTIDFTRRHNPYTWLAWLRLPV